MYILSGQKKFGSDITKKVELYILKINKLLHPHDRTKSWRNFTLITLEIYEQKKSSPLFEIHYATFRVKQKTYYANVKENFITQVNVVS